VRTIKISNEYGLEMASVPRNPTTLDEAGSTAELRVKISFIAVASRGRRRAVAAALAADVAQRHRKDAAKNQATIG
jgi:hypothetical protein